MPETAMMDILTGDLHGEDDHGDLPGDGHHGDLPGDGDHGDLPGDGDHGDHTGDPRAYKTLPKMVEHVVLK